MSKIIEKTKDYISGILSKNAIKKQIKSKNNGPIVFLCQCESVWSKSRSVFIELKKHNVEVKLLVVDDTTVDHKEKTIFEKEFKEDVIKYHAGIIDEIKPSIIFLSRPYDHYLPLDLHTKNLIKKASLAYIPYYYSIEEETGLHTKRFLNRIRYY